MNTDTQLIKAASPIIPKPTKTEIIAAMVEIAREKFKAQQVKAAADLQALIEKQSKKARAFVIKNIRTIELRTSHWWRSGYDVTIELRNPEFEAMAVEEDKLKDFTRARFDEVATRRFIRDSLTNTPSHEERVALILSNPESKEHLTGVLKAIRQPALSE